jgi:hypothetical protein
MISVRSVGTISGKQVINASGLTYVALKRAYWEL